LSFARFVKTREKHIAGQSMVELALALPLLIMIVIGLIEMGIIFASYVSLVNAAREGAIFASMYPALVSSTCGSSPNSICVGTHDNDPIAGGPVVTATTSIWDEYYQRVNNEVIAVLGDKLKAGEILNEDNLTIYRPIIGCAGIGCSLCPGSDALAPGCPIYVSLRYRLHTLTSDMSLPGVGRLGLPNYYVLTYTMRIPIR
jgi:hypothetical protein